MATYIGLLFQSAVAAAGLSAIHVDGCHIGALQGVWKRMIGLVTKLAKSSSTSRNSAPGISRRSDGDTRMDDVPAPAPKVLWIKRLMRSVDTNVLVRKKTYESEALTGNGGEVDSRVGKCLLPSSAASGTPRQAWEFVNETMPRPIRSFRREPGRILVDGAFGEIIASFLDARALRRVRFITVARFSWRRHPIDSAASSSSCLGFAPIDRFDDGVSSTALRVRRNGETMKTLLVGTRQVARNWLNEHSIGVRVG